ncbi:hypothetical protein V6N12_073327 [Hibiscus sabdariffa]|uniref:Uncharacterized protein n=1 Tax=Hibiscus sabdariffa TaxID=183260 RepID=A0ABR2AGI3_9ROSI
MFASGVEVEGKSEAGSDDNSATKETFGDKVVVEVSTSGVESNGEAEVGSNALRKAMLLLESPKLRRKNHMMSGGLSADEHLTGTLARSRRQGRIEELNHEPKERRRSVDKAWKTPCETGAILPTLPQNCKTSEKKTFFFY